MSTYCTFPNVVKSIPFSFIFSKHNSRLSPDRANGGVVDELHFIIKAISNSQLYSITFGRNRILVHDQARVFIGIAFDASWKYCKSIHHTILYLLIFTIESAFIYA